MKILIVDDEALARNELSYLVEQSPHTIDVEIETAEDIHEAEDILLMKKIDILFLDISLNDENGFDLAKKLDNLANPPLVIFATAYDEYAIKAFDIDAIDYILKPFEQQRIDKALEKAIKFLKKTKIKQNKTKTIEKSDFITITIKEHGIVLKKNDIIAGTIENGKLTLYTEKNEYQIKATLAWLKKKIDTDYFVQIHRNTIVNLNKIKEVQPWFNHTMLVITINNIKLPVGRSYLKELNKKIGLN